MSLLQEIQELAQVSTQQPYIAYEQIASVQILKPNEYEESDPEHPKKLYYFCDFLLNGYLTHISTEIPFGIKVTLN